MWLPSNTTSRIDGTSCQDLFKGRCQCLHNWLTCKRYSLEGDRGADSLFKRKSAIDTCLNSLGSDLAEESLEVKLPTICRDGKAKGGKSQGGEVKK